MQRSLLQLLAVLAVVLLASHYWNLNNSAGSRSAALTGQQGLAKTYLSNTRSWLYNERGELSEVLESERARRMLISDISELQAPKYYSHNGDNRTWSASSDQGRFDHKNGTLMLTDNVSLTNDHTGGRLSSSKMKIDIDKKTAISSVPVEIAHGVNRINADGMIADLNKETIQMKPNVESIYVAPSS